MGCPELKLVVILALAPPVTAAEPDAAALVRQVRQREAWIETVESIQIRAVQHWERTPKGLEHRRRELEANFPGTRPETDPNLRERLKWNIELAFDRSRIRLRVQDEGYSDDLRIWDGKRFILQNRYAKWPGLRPDQEGTLFKSDLSMLSWLVWVNFSSFRAGPHVFWWNSPKERAEIERMTAKPEDFAYEGRADFHGLECDVVSHWASWTSLFIGVDDGRLHGIREGAQTTAKVKQSLVSLYRELGRQVKDEADMERQAPSLTQEERARLERLGATRLTQLIDPVFEFQLSLNREAAPGCRLPLVQTIRYFEVDTDGQPFESMHNELRILECKVNDPLPDALFTVTLREGEWVTDQTHDPPLRYRYKPSFTPDEWSAIVQEAKRKAEEKAERLKAARKRQGRG
jgi:hypothetical protein